MSNKKIPDAVLPEPKNPKKWIVGSGSGIVYRVEKMDGNWTNVKATFEKQNLGLETYTCTNQWGTKTYELQMNYQIAEHQISEENQQWLRDNGYFDVSGNINFSAKAMAIKSGTKAPGGNYISATPEVARTWGLIPESMLPFGKPTNLTDFFNPNQITPAMDKLAAEFNKRFIVEYEEIFDGLTPGWTMKMLNDAIVKHLRQAPLSISIAICAGYHTTNIIPVCPQKPIHCVGLIADNTDARWIFDSYDPFHKRIAKDYIIPYVMKAIIYERGTKYTATEIMNARNFALQIKNQHKQEYIFRPDANGELYYIQPDGSLEYLFQPAGKGFDHMIRVTKTIIPVGEKDFSKLVPALIK